LPCSSLNNSHRHFRASRRAPEKLSLRPFPLCYSNGLASRAQNGFRTWWKESLPISEGGVHHNDGPILRRHTTHEIWGRSNRIHLWLLTLRIKHFSGIDAATLHPILSSRRGRLEILCWNQRGDKRTEARAEGPGQRAWRLCQARYRPDRSRL